MSEIKNLKEFVSNSVIEYLSKNDRLLDFISSNLNIQLYECHNIRNKTFDNICQGWGTFKKKPLECSQCKKKFCEGCRFKALLAGNYDSCVCVECIESIDDCKQIICHVCDSSEYVKSEKLPDNLIYTYWIYCHKCKCIIKTF